MAVVVVVLLVLFALRRCRRGVLTRMILKARSALERCCIRSSGAEREANGRNYSFHFLTSRSKMESACATCVPVKRI
jgi:hypothetical protein